MAHPSWLKVLAALIAAGWAPLIVRQFIRYRQRRHPGRLALVSSMLLLAFFGSSALWADGLSAEDHAWTWRLLYFGNAIACVHFYLAIWRGAALERKLPASPLNNGHIPEDAEAEEGDPKT